MEGQKVLAAAKHSSDESISAVAPKVRFGRACGKQKEWRQQNEI
jgi:hypothetical protein